MSDLHNTIMNLPCAAPKEYDINQRLAYQAGHRDARHAAADLANAPPGGMHQPVGLDYAEEVKQRYRAAQAGGEGETSTIQTRLAEVEAENERLRRELSGKLISSTLLTELTTNSDGLFMGLKGGAAQLLAGAFADQFRGTGATNYLELRFTNDDLNLLVTLQNLAGKTPHQLRADAEQHAARLVREGSNLCRAAVAFQDSLNKLHEAEERLTDIELELESQESQIQAAQSVVDDAQDTRSDRWSALTEAVYYFRKHAGIDVDGPKEQTA